jgi:hypothetical protein
MLVMGASTVLMDPDSTYVTVAAAEGAATPNSPNTARATRLRIVPPPFP